MSSILSGDTGESRGEQSSETSDQLVRAIEVVLEEAESGQSSGSRDRSILRPLLVVDLREAIRHLRGGREGATEAIEQTAEEALSTEMTGDRRGSGGSGRSDGSQGSGRGTLSKLFLVGVVVGLGYVMRKRSGSVGEAVTEATERVRGVADETERRSGEMAGRTEAAAGEAADRIEQTGETVADEAADRVRESGQMAADSVQETGEMAADEMEGAAEKTEEAENKAEEKADEMDGSGDEDEESEE